MPSEWNRKKEVLCEFENFRLSGTLLIIGFTERCHLKIYKSFLRKQIPFLEFSN